MNVLKKLAIALLLALPVAGAVAAEQHTPTVIGVIAATPQRLGGVHNLLVSGEFYALAPDFEVVWQGGRHAGLVDLVAGSRVELTLRRVGGTALVQRITLLPD